MARNKKLLEATETYLVCLRNNMRQPTSKNVERLLSAERLLESIVSIESKQEDITEMFEDLRDYWETLDVNK